MHLKDTTTARSCPITTPDLAALSRELYALYDPWQFDPYEPDRHEISDRIWRCGSGRAHTYGDGGFKPHITMCETWLCETCAAWKINGDGNKQSLRQLYDALPAPIFDGSPVVYCQPFPFDSADPGGFDTITKRARRARKESGGSWHRVNVFANTWRDIVFMFGDDDLSQPDDLWPAHVLEPDTARAFLFDELIQPGVLAHKPSAARGCPWELPHTEKGGTGWIRVGWVNDATTSAAILDLADDKLRAKKNRMRATGASYELHRSLEHEIARTAHDAATAEVLAGGRVRENRY